jgi:hypothetical protein
MSYNARIILNEILTSSSFKITDNNCGLFMNSIEWDKVKLKIKSIPEDCQLMYLKGWISERQEEDTKKWKEREEKEKKEREEKEEKEKNRKDKEEKDKKEREEKDKKEREEKEKKERADRTSREFNVAEHTLFAHYGPGLAFAMPVPGYPSAHLHHIGGGTFVPGIPPIGFIAPGFIGPGFIRAHRF